ncbi:MAG: hypothetical protein Q4C82_00235 [Eubacteriales bacterium]|nr:hypothetical protein [Eubacteriales bacterium]
MRKTTIPFAGTIIGLIILSMIGICLTACGAAAVDSGDENLYVSLIADLGDEDAYALLEMEYSCHVFVTSDRIYDAGSESQAAVACDVYYYTGTKPEKLGTVMSEGTAYPVSFSKDGIYAASGHHIEKYAVSEEDGVLYLEKGVYETFDDNGNAHYTCILGTEEQDSTEQEFTEMAEEYAAGQIIHFAYGASDGCLNHIL